MKAGCCCDHLSSGRHLREDSAETVSEYQQMYVVFDRYRDEIIKGTIKTRPSKAARLIRRLVEGRDVPLPKNWSNCLSLADRRVNLRLNPKNPCVYPSKCMHVVACCTNGTTFGTPMQIHLEMVVHQIKISRVTYGALGGGCSGSKHQKSGKTTKRPNRLAPNLAHIFGFIREWT